MDSIIPCDNRQANPIIPAKLDAGAVFHPNNKGKPAEHLIITHLTLISLPDPYLPPGETIRKIFKFSIIPLEAALACFVCGGVNRRQFSECHQVEYERVKERACTPAPAGWLVRLQPPPRRQQLTIFGQRSVRQRQRRATDVFHQNGNRSSVLLRYHLIGISSHCG